MSLKINNLQTQLPTGSVVIVYDIEGVGNVSDPASCYMWNLSAAVMGQPNNVFDQYIDPPLQVIPDPPNPKLFKVTKEFLKDANAQQCGDVLRYFFKWISNNSNPQTGYVVLVSHGNFRYDQPLLEKEMRRHAIEPCPNLYFFDTLYWFRNIKKNRRSYSLNNLYYEQFKKPVRNAHLSLFDVHALYDLIEAQNKVMNGIMYKYDSTSLLTVPSIGLYTENLLFNANIDSVEQLVFKFINDYKYNPMLLQQALVKINVRPCIAATVAHTVANSYVF